MVGDFQTRDLQSQKNVMRFKSQSCLKNNKLMLHLAICRKHLSSVIYILTETTLCGVWCSTDSRSRSDMSPALWGRLADGARCRYKDLGALRSTDDIQVGEAMLTCWLLNWASMKVQGFKRDADRPFWPEGTLPESALPTFGCAGHSGPSREVKPPFQWHIFRVIKKSMYVRP